MRQSAVAVPSHPLLYESKNKDRVAKKLQGFKGMHSPVSFNCACTLLLQMRHAVMTAH